MENKKAKILIVDDDELIRFLAADILSKKYEVIQAVDGQDGLDKALEYKPDLVITDLMMPNLHGFQLCKVLRGPNGLPGVKIIVSSSKPYETDKTQARRLGVDLYIIKPFGVEELLSTVAKLLKGKI